MRLLAVFALLVISQKLFADEYLVKLDQHQGLIDVRACLNDPSIDLLTNGDRRSHKYLSYVKQGQQVLTASRNGIRLLPGTDFCIEYRYDLNKAVQDKKAMKVGDSWVVNNQAWLWTPKNAEAVHIKFDQPISAPWEKTKQGYLIDKTTKQWTSRMAFGNVNTYTVKVQQQQLHVAIVGVQPDLKRKQLVEWIEQASNAVGELYQRFPVNQAQILIVSIGKRSEAVPWGEVQRGGSPAVHLFIDPYRPISEFVNDWTAVHELSHLLIPMVDGNDRWISEGIASYYQNVLRSRSGLASSEMSWNKLKAGFARGRKAARNDNMESAHKIMHIYWGGAAIFFLADLRLRELPTALTLGEVLKRFQQCCRPSKISWSAQKLMTKLDQLSNSSVFSELLNYETQAFRFPIDEKFESATNPLIEKHLTTILRATD